MKKNKSGFTLVELLVVVFIVGLLSTILIVNWRNNEKRLLIQRKAQEIIQDFNKTRNLSLTGNTYCNNQPCPSYGIRFFDNSADYLVFGDMNDNNRYDASQDIVIENISLGEDVEVYRIIYIGSGVYAEPSDVDFNFSVPDGFSIVDNNSAILYTYIWITRTGKNCAGAGNCKLLIVDSAGVIR